MEVQELAPGLWRWTAVHPDWTPAQGGPKGWERDVGCLYYEASDAVVLVDPLAPAEGNERDRFWRAFERDVERAGLPLHVLVTIFWHARSAGEVVRRLGARLWAPARGRAAIERRTNAVTDVFRPGEPLPGGVEAFATARATEVVFWIPEHRALVFGDVVLGREDGGVRLCPDSWLPEGKRATELAASLRPLLDLPAERLLVSHGEPVLAGGRDALARAVG